MAEKDPYIICAAHRRNGIPINIRFVENKGNSVYFLYYGYQPAITICRTKEELLWIIEIVAEMHRRVKENRR